MSDSSATYVSQLGRKYTAEASCAAEQGMVLLKVLGASEAGHLLPSTRCQGSDEVNVAES